MLCKLVDTSGCKLWGWGGGGVGGGKTNIVLNVSLVE